MQRYLSHVYLTEYLNNMLVTMWIVKVKAAKYFEIKVLYFFVTLGSCPCVATGTK